MSGGCLAVGGDKSVTRVGQRGRKPLADDRQAMRNEDGLGR